MVRRGTARIQPDRFPIQVLGILPLPVPMRANDRQRGICIRERGIQFDRPCGCGPHLGNTLGRVQQAIVDEQHVGVG